MGDILKELDANAKTPAWVDKAVKEFEAETKAEVPEWVDKEVQRLKAEAAKYEQTQS
ncbi:MAG: hypothetical protein IJ520_04335 [Synergistaceae bacterium]|nr:hypothetical protein [Synergistaceae bacterium]MBR1604242.1 hypothetical protein [Synergistaceae bacterium]